MKPTLFLTLLAFACIPVPVLPAQAQEKAAAVLTGNIQVQITAFKVSGPELALSLLNTPLSGEEALFLQLAGRVAGGSAELLSDNHLTVPGDSGKPPENEAGPFSSSDREGFLESTKETPFPSEYTPQERGRELVPKAFERKNGGLASKVQLELIPQGPHAVPASAGVSGSLLLSRIRADQLTSWPVSLPGTSAEASLDLPQFLTDTTSTTFRSADARHHLISVSRQAGETMAAGQDDYQFVFAKAAPEAESLRGNPSPGAANDDAESSATAGALRLHALTFQLPDADGRALLRSRQAGGGDQALLDALLQAAAEKKAQLRNHFILRLDSLQPTPAPKSRDPFASRPPSARMETIEEFAYPTEYSEDLLPQSFEYQNLNRALGVCVEKPAASGGTRLSLFFETRSVAPQLFAWPEAPANGPRPPQVYYPAFPTTKLHATLSVQLGGAYCLGAITLPSFFPGVQPEESLMEIYLLKIAGSRQPPVSSQTPPTGSTSQPDISSEVMSLSAQDAAVLKGLSQLPAEAEAMLSRLTEDGSARSIAWSQVSGTAAQNPEIRAEVLTPFPMGCDRTPGGFLRPCQFEIYSLGHFLQFISPPDMNGFQFLHTSAPFPQPSNTELLEAANQGGKDPPGTIKDRSWQRTPRAGRLPEPERFEIECRDRSPGDGPKPFQIISLAPARVPAGHPEAGRWHTVILRSTAR